MSQKISKSDQDPEIERANMSVEQARMHKLMTQPHIGTQPGDPCTIVFRDGRIYHGHYTESGWIADNQRR